MSLKKALSSCVKTNMLLVISSVLAIISCFFTIPSEKYISYIDFRTLALLFMLMLVVSGYKKIGFFYFIGKKILMKVKNKRDLILILTLLCFFSSMLITNDVSLITFVPLAIMIINMSGFADSVCLIITLMTIAANLGSMLTPLGNPQNLYLFNKSGLSVFAFLKLMLPYSAIALIILIFLICIIFNKKSESAEISFSDIYINKRALLLYTILFMLCLLTVLQIIDIRIIFFVEIIAVLAYDKLIFKDVDYSLLLTFVAFFIFIGNMGAYAPLHTFLENIINEHELITAVASSQVISNVPSALLLSGFSSKWNLLIIGTNIGGLGTLIASMASLISYKQVCTNYQNLRIKYILVFTIYNIIFLSIYLVILYFGGIL